MKLFHKAKSILVILALLLGSTIIIVSGCHNRDKPKTNSKTNGIKIGTLQAADSGTWKTISPKEALTLIEANKGNNNFIILDVRRQYEYKSGHICNAILLDFYSSDFKEKLSKLDRDKIYLIYCRSGVRSKKAFKLMKELKFKHVYNLSGGFSNWEKQNLPIDKSPN